MEIKKDELMVWKAMAITRGIFKQMRQINQKEYADHIKGEGLDPADPMNWLGYVLEAVDSSVGEIQRTWFVFTVRTAPCRILDSELFWVLRACTFNMDHPEVDLRNALPQIFVT